MNCSPAADSSVCGWLSPFSFFLQGWLVSSQSKRFINIYFLLIALPVTDLLDNY